MARVTQKEIARIGHLARLDLTKAEVKSLTADMNQILGYVKTLSDLDLADLEPTAHATRIPTPFREDVVQPSLSVEDALREAPAHDEGGFIVPRIIE